MPVDRVTTRQVEFNSPYGQVIWTLSQETIDILALVPPDVLTKVFEGLGSNITILCGATLKAFDNPGVVETLNLVMQELREIITNEPTT